MSPPPSSLIDPNSGFCPTNSTFYTKRPPISLPPNPVLDLTTFISARGHLHHNATAFVDATTGHKLKYSQLWQAVDSVSSALSSPSIGVRKGHVILILSPNSIYFPVVCLSAMSLGAIITTTNPLNTSAEIAKQAADSNPFLAFTTPELLPKLAGSNFPIILITDGDHKITVHISSSSQSGSKILTTLEELMATKPSESRIRDRVTQNDTASLLYSSGTTGATKGVISSHANLIAMVEIVIQRFKPRQDSNHHHQQQQVFICTVPMFHIYGMAAFATGLLATGAMIVVLPKFEINDLFTAIERYKVTHFPLVPPIFVAMVNQARGVKKRYDLSTLRVILCGGAPLGKEVIEGFVKEYPGVEISQGYGLTESAAMGTSTNCLEENRRYGTAGLLNPNMEGKIVDPESGRACGVKETGELWIRGPTIMKGYFQNPEATAATITPDGWLKTGDICYIDEDGFLFVVDRLKELIKYKGYQVPPAELEALLLTHPHIDDAAVIPYPDKDVGQFPMAYVVRKPQSSLSEDSVMEFVAKQVAPYKRIRRVAFTNSIPKNPSGKTLRKDLIKMATSTARL